MANFITDDDLKEWIGVGTSGHDSLFSIVNTGATARIVGWCGRTFQTVASSARYFTPLSYTECPVDDASTITAVATDNAEDGLWSTVWDAADWYAAPVGNIGPAGQTGWPYTKLVACEARWFTPSIRPYVKVTAAWGWTAVPDDVKLAARLLGAELFKLHESPLGTSWTADNGDVPIIRDNKPLRDLLQPYKKARAADARFMVA